MTNSQGPTIASILAGRNASLRSGAGDQDVAVKRAPLTRLIEDNYQAFEPVRNLLLNRTGGKTNGQNQESLCDHGHAIIDKLHKHELIHETEGCAVVKHSEAKRYLGGGWLEELAWLAAVEAGADEAVFSQTLSWNAKGYHGQNEIDLIFRKGERLGFTSCKAVNSDFDSDSRKQRNRLMDALHEADNLVDHFGAIDDRVAILVTADLIDEVRNQPRYMALMGKAAVLEVRVIPLEELGWDKLVAAMSELINED